tara:strand:+ start:698 stop:835 length:138 start_codon:yes stop_codon:yes gene_type:complete
VEIEKEGERNVNEMRMREIGEEGEGERNGEGEGERKGGVRKGTRE